MSTDIRIYVADLAAYNAGHLHGAWVDATQDMESILEQVDAMLATSPVEGAEEYAIHDFEGFGNYRIGEFERLDRVREIACFIDEYPELGAALLAHFNDLDEARQVAGEAYCGCYASLADYAQELTEQTTSIPDNLAGYIDYCAMARDLEYGGEVLVIETGFEQVHVFIAY